MTSLSLIYDILSKATLLQFVLIFILQKKNTLWNLLNEETSQS